MSRPSGPAVAEWQTHGYFLGGALAPLGLTVSFLARPLPEVHTALTSWRRGLGHVLEESQPRKFPECTAVLDPLEAPWIAELLIDCGSWTAYLNNGIDGGDPTAAAPYLSLNCDCAVAQHSPLQDPGHAATQLWMFGPRGQPPLMYVRTISAYAEDGQWVLARQWRGAPTIQTSIRWESGSGNWSLTRADRKRLRKSERASAGKRPDGVNTGTPPLRCWSSHRFRTVTRLTTQVWLRSDIRPFERSIACGWAAAQC
jgi:hypothetical protein